MRSFAIKDGFLPSNFVQSRFQRNHLDIIKELQKQKLLEPYAKSKMYNGKKMSCYKMTKKFIDLFNESQEELEELKD